MAEPDPAEPGQPPTAAGADRPGRRQPPGLDRTDSDWRSPPHRTRWHPALACVRSPYRCVGPAADRHPDGGPRPVSGDRRAGDPQSSGTGVVGVSGLRRWRGAASCRGARRRARGAAECADGTRQLSRRRSRPARAADQSAGGRERIPPGLGSGARRRLCRHCAVDGRALHRQPRAAAARVDRTGSPRIALCRHGIGGVQRGSGVGANDRRADCDCRPHDRPRAEFRRHRPRAGRVGGDGRGEKDRRSESPPSIRRRSTGWPPGSPRSTAKASRWCRSALPAAAQDPENAPAAAAEAARGGK